MREFFRILSERDIVNKDYEKNICRSRMFVSIILAISALLMFVMNIINHSTLMVYSSAVLVVGFIISAVVAGVFKAGNISAIIIALLVGFVLSIFAISGGNEGFAILWVLLVPLFSISLLGIVPGLVVSTYFLVFLLIIFSAPLQHNFTDYYSTFFINRFPVLYFADYAIATYFSLQREYLQKKLMYQAYSDGLTGLYNRRYFMEQLNSIKPSDVFSLIMVDLNGLKTVNDKLGHKMGDDFICRVAKLCADEFKKESKVCRIGGDEFAIITRGSESHIKDKIKALQKSAEKINKKLDYTFSFSTGVANSSDIADADVESILKIADEEMYKYKAEYYKNKENNRRKR